MKTTKIMVLITILFLSMISVNAGPYPSTPAPVYDINSVQALETQAKLKAINDQPLQVPSPLAADVKKEVKDKKKDVPQKVQVCRVSIAQGLLGAVKDNPSGICMGGELFMPPDKEIILPPAFVDLMTKPIPNLRPTGDFDEGKLLLSCSIPCSVGVKKTCLKDLGVGMQGVNYDVNSVDRTQCGDATLGQKVSAPALPQKQAPVVPPKITSPSTQKQVHPQKTAPAKKITMPPPPTPFQPPAKVAPAQQKALEQKMILQQIRDFFVKLFW